ncbi:MAG: hypothetical protein EOP84_16445 [Verrucomicrobiaceae bacterium]|nr:MAG: hypothetical protein EOP84_16445 [Verrucomicrobiaceae bacterium]
MNTKGFAAVFLLAFICRAHAAIIITDLTRLDTDQTGGRNEAIFSSFGGPVYHDYSFTYTSWPSYLNGAEMVRMVNGDAMDSDYQLQLTLSQPATVYLMIDNRTDTAALPWVSAQGFQNTGDIVMVWDFPYSVYATAASAGTFIVRENARSLNMYTLAVVPEPSVALHLGVVTVAAFGRRHRSPGHSR